MFERQWPQVWKAIKHPLWMVYLCCVHIFKVCIFVPTERILHFFRGRCAGGVWSRQTHVPTKGEICQNHPTGQRETESTPRLPTVWRNKVSWEPAHSDSVDGMIPLNKSSYQPGREVALSLDHYSWRNASPKSRGKRRLVSTVRLLQKFWHNAKSMTERYWSVIFSTSTQPISMEFATSCLLIFFTS